MTARTTNDTAPQPQPLLPLRTALIVLTAVIIGAVIGGLAMWGHGSLPTALLAGLSGAGMAVLPLDKIIGR